MDAELAFEEIFMMDSDLENYQTCRALIERVERQLLPTNNISSLTRALLQERLFDLKVIYCHFIYN